MVSSDEDKARIKRDKAKEAIALALGSRWEEAMVLNREIIQDFPRDVEAHNRLGKALSELGQYREAEDAFRQAVEISPANVIARKNLQRLAHLGEDNALPKRGSQVTPQLFIEERGKTATVSLKGLSPDRAHLRMAPGDAVDLKVLDNGMAVESPNGDYLGEVDPRLGLRLARLIRGGNSYTAAITAVDAQRLVIMIKETYQHPSQYGTVSFPARQSARGAYPNLGIPPVPIDLELEEEEEGLERAPIIDWDEEGEPTIPAPPTDTEATASFLGGDVEEEAGI